MTVFVYASLASPQSWPYWEGAAPSHSLRLHSSRLQGCGRPSCRVNVGSWKREEASSEACPGVGAAGPWPGTGPCSALTHCKVFSWQCSSSDASSLCKKGVQPSSGAVSLNCCCHSKNGSHSSWPLGQCFKLKVLFSCSLSPPTPAYFQERKAGWTTSGSCLCSLVLRRTSPGTLDPACPSLSAASFPGFPGRLAPDSPVIEPTGQHQAVLPKCCLPHRHRFVSYVHYLFK